MSASPPAERCSSCGRKVQPEWRPPVICAGRALAGTGVWRTSLHDDRCPQCATRRGKVLRSQAEKRALEERLTRLMGGPRPAREFTFERFRLEDGNRAAFTYSRSFAAETDNLYLWGHCGIGKTHLAYAIGRAAVQAGRSAAFLTQPELMRRVRMKDPDDEQRAIDQLVRTEVLVLDDLGLGADTPYSRQILQEILDRRRYRNRGGLVITTKYSLDQLAAKLGDDSIPSRLAGMCTFAPLAGLDHRLNQATPRTLRGSH